MPRSHRGGGAASGESPTRPCRDAYLDDLDGHLLLLDAVVGLSHLPKGALPKQPLDLKPILQNLGPGTTPAIGQMARGCQDSGCT